MNTLSYKTLSANAATVDKQWLVVVATDPKPEAVRAFWATGKQGVNYHQNVWHHPLLVLEPQQFVIIDRGGDGHNCDEIELPMSVQIQTESFQLV